MNAMTKEQDHAYQNAASWAQSVAQMVEALECDYDRLEELRDERADLASEADDYTNAEHELAQAHLVAWDADHAEELRELIKAATIDGDKIESDEQARERIQGSPLSVQIRSGWYSPGETPEPSEFEILLSTGGPALRIRGELDDHNQPDRAWLEYQDWGTPWTEYHGDGCEKSTLLTFCQQFYFGE